MSCHDGLAGCDCFDPRWVHKTIEGLKAERDSARRLVAASLDVYRMQRLEAEVAALKGAQAQTKG